MTPSYSSDTPSAVTGIAKQVEKLTEEKRYAEAFELAHKGAENGDSECMKQMGNFYCFGQEWLRLLQSAGMVASFC